MTNSLQSVAEGLRSNRSVSPKRRSSGTAIMDSMDDGTAERGPNGIRIVRSATIIGLTGVPHSKIPDALNARGLPRYGEAHPSPLADGLPLSHMMARIMDGEPDKAIVTLTYEFPSSTGGIGWFENTPSETTAPQIEVSTTLNQLTTNFDGGGNQMFVEHQYPPRENGVELPLTKQTGEAAIMVPTTSVNYMRRESVSPLSKARQYVGKTNSTRIFGDPARYWLCTGLGGPSDDGGLTYNVTYSFQRAEPHAIAGFDVVPGWDAIIVFIDPTTGKPPASDRGGPVKPIGLKGYVMYLSINFWNLNLTTV